MGSCAVKEEIFSLEDLGISPRNNSKFASKTIKSLDIIIKRWIINYKLAQLSFPDENSISST